MEGFVQKVSAPRGKRRNKPPVCGGRTAPPKAGKDNPPLREKLKRQREKPNKICKTVAVPLPRKTTLSKLETLNSAIPWLQTHRLPGMSAAPRFGTNTINTLFGKPDFRRRRRFATSPNLSIARVKKTGGPQKRKSVPIPKSGVENTTNLQIFLQSKNFQTPRFIRILAFF